MAQLISARLNKGDAPSLGFRLQGGIDFGTPLLIQKVNIGSPAEKAGLLAGDSVVKINSTDVYNLRHKDAQDVIIRAGPSFEITVQRGGSTWKPSVTPLPKTPSSGSFSPVTKTSLAAKPQSSIGSIGTEHNLSAKPFSPQLNGAVNGGPKLVNKQYNSPVGLYSEASIAETLSAQAEVLSTGVLGVNFKKNERNYDASNSAVFRMVQEADKEPRDQEPEPDSGVVNAPLGVGGLRHVQAPETKPTAPTTPIPPGQNICAECERLIVGVFVRIKDKNLHVECFKCSTCGSSLKNVGYYNINQKLYCDIHAKLAAKSSAPSPNLVPVTVLPGGKAPVGTISAALASHTLPSTAPLSPTTGSSNLSAQPFQSGSFPSPRPYSSVSGPLSPSVNNYSTLPKTSPIAPSLASPTVPSQEKGHSVHNIIWPPSSKSDDRDLPTATPLYLPPPTHLRILRKPFLFDNTSKKEDSKLLAISAKSDFLENPNTTIVEPLKPEDVNNISRDMETKMSMCSTEVTNITERQLAVERIERATESQRFVESMVHHRPKSPPPLELQPKVEVETEQRYTDACETLNGNIRACSTAPRVVTSVCVCTNPCCEAKNGGLCENCPMGNLKKATDYQKTKIQAVENCTLKRHGSPIITGVSVTINNPGKIKDSGEDLFTQIPEKKTTSALGSALATTPKEPFTPASSSYPEKPISLPEETKPYLPPERSIIQEQKPSKPPQPKPQEPEKTMTSALRIAPERPFTPVNPPPAPLKTKKPKEDPLLADLPKPTQWMSMVTALTTAPEKPFSAVATESSVTSQVLVTDSQMEEVSRTTETQKQINRASVTNKTFLPKPFRTQNLDNVHDSEATSQVNLSSATSTPEPQHQNNHHHGKVADKMSVQTAEQASVVQQERVQIQEHCHRQEKIQEHDRQYAECSSICSKADKQLRERVVEKQTEETILRKPLELAGYLQKREYIPQYQMSLYYDETIQLPHHKDIKKLLPENQKKREDKDTRCSASNTQKYMNQSSSQYLSTSSNQSTEITKSMVTTKSENSMSIPQVVFQPVVEDKPPTTTFSPKPGRLTPSMINNPPPVLPYYQEQLVPTKLPPPEINIFDPKSPAISRSPSPCPASERATSPFKPVPPRPISPAAGPPPNPLTKGEPIPKFNKDYYQVQNAKKNISGYIPQYREKVDGIEFINTADVSVSRTREEISKCAETTRICSFEAKNKKCTNTDRSDLQAAALVANTQECNNSLKVNFTQENRNDLMSKEKQPHNISSSDPSQQAHNANINIPKIKEQSQSTTEPKCFPPKGGSSSRGQMSTFQVDQTNTKRVDLSQCNSTPATSVSVPTVSQPNTGSGGGRQPGAVGVTPKRGRGTLNVGGLIGSRVPLCGHCHSQIRGPFITALGKIWCPEHFICNTPSCRRPLQDLGFVEEQGQLYCEYCFEQYLAPPCSKCGAKVKGDCLKAIGKNFHPECFSCSYCGKLFGNSPFFLEDGQPYCENDWNELFTTKCFACGFPVEAGDRWVEALNNNYHSQCFNCTMCKKNLEGQSFFAKGGRPFCKNHAR